MLQSEVCLPSVDKPWLKHYSEQAIHTLIPDGNMYDCIYEANKENLDGTAMIYQKRKISYRQMFAKIDMFADCLSANGIREGDHVTILSLNTPETVCLIYAINKIGAISCPEYVTQSSSSLRDSLNSIKPKMVIVLNVFLKAYYDVLAGYAGTILVLSPVEILSAPVRFLIHSKLGIPKKIPENSISYASFIRKRLHCANTVSCANHPAVYIPTSGSTGTPKKVVLTNRNLNSIAVQYPDSGMKIQRGAKMLSLAPPFLSVGITLSIHMPLVCGVTLILSIDPSPKNSAEMFAKTKPNYYLGATDYIMKIIEHPKLQNADLSYLYCCMLGGESIAPAIKEKINAFLLSHNAPNGMLTGYGMTEVSGAAVTETNMSARDSSVGLPLPLINIRVRNLDDNSECPVGHHGELLISSPGIMDCYFNNTTETNETIEIDSNGERWLHTGDLGYVDADGFVYIVGRLKRIFTTVDTVSGMMYKLFPGQIENELDKLPFISRSAVLVIEDPERVHIPTAYVKLINPPDNWADEILHYLSNVLPDYEIPTQITALDEIPLLDSGKINYKLIETTYLA